MQPIIIIPAYEPDNKLLTLVQKLAGTNQQITIVDDGSISVRAKSIFSTLTTFPNIKILKHEENLGKGAALKTAFQYYLTHYATQCSGVVTADADGQHSAEDIIKIIEHFEKEPTKLLLGSRKFSGKVPWQNRFGNYLTRKIFRFLMGKNIYDTQTGLRAIPNNLIQQLLTLQSNSYDFELDMLILASRKKIVIEEMPIKTIYTRQQTSHFNPLIDSVKVYFVFFRFLSSSILTAIFDFIVFSILYFISTKILLSIIVARLFAGTFNFLVNKKIAFKSEGQFIREAFKYLLLLVCMGIVVYGLIKACILYAGINVYVSKIMVETLFFFISFTIQRVYVFAGKDNLTPNPSPDYRRGESGI